MLKRVNKFRKQLSQSSVSPASEPAASSRDLSLETPLVRVLAKRVGLGEPASLLQEATSAAVAEAGKRHLTRSTRWAAKLGNSGKRPQHIEDRLHKAAFKSSNVRLKVPVSSASILVKDVVARHRRPAAKSKAKAKARIRLVRLKPKKKSVNADATTPKCVQWPVFMPHLLFKGLIDGGLIKDLSGDMDWLDFWDRASHEEWGRGHPVLDWSPEDRARAIAISLHGDEGQGKRGKSTMVLSWSPLAVHRPALLNKYPFCVIQADHFHYEGTKNVTLGGLQKCLADSLNMCNQPGNTTLQGYSLHLTVGKGDWKFRREWLQMPRSYLNADLICPRCFASGTPGSQKPWLDPVRERYNNTADLLLAQDSRVGPDIALHSVKGWSPLGEMADLLHAVWIGTARDAVGSLLLDLAEFHPQCQSMTTWDERLKLLHAEILTFCCENGIRQSTIEEISLTKLSVEHVTLDYPQGFSKGYANRVLIAYIAKRMGDLDLPQLRAQSVCAWALNRYQKILDNADMWLKDGEAQELGQVGRIYIETFTSLAQLNLSMLKPRFRVRPKLHQMACELVARFSGIPGSGLPAGSARLNPRWGSCWSEEDWIGKLCRISKGAVHGKTLAQRVLQRWCLHYNSSAEPRAK